MKNKKNKYEIVQQREEYDCASACLSMILKNFFSINISIFELKPIVKNCDDGTKFSDLYRGMKAIGISSKLCRGTLNREIFNEITYPIITQIKTNEGIHYIVIFSATKRKLIIGDPSDIKVNKISKKNFLKNWIPFFISVNVKESKLKIKNIDKKRISSFNYIKQEKSKIFLIILISIITYVIGIFLSGMFNLYFNLVIPQKLSFLVTSFLTIYLLVCLFSQLMKLLQSIVNNSVSKLFDEKILRDYFKGILDKPKFVTNEYNAAELLTDVQNITTIRQRILAVTVQIPVDILWVAVNLSILFKINHKLSFLTIIMLISLLYVIILPNSRYQLLGEKLINSMTTFNLFLMDHIENIRKIKEFKVNNFFLNLLSKKYDELLTQRNSLSNFDSTINSIRQFISSSFSIILFSFGVIEIINDSLSTGSLLMFNSLLGYTIDPLLEIANFQSLLIQGRVAIERVNTAMSKVTYVENSFDTGELSKSKINDISVSNLCFSFDASHKLLNNISFYISKNSNVAITGENGSGKTTIGKLISRLLLYDSGSIKFNGINIDQIPDSIINEKICFASTDDKIINDSIINNIRLYRSIDRKNIIRKADQIGLLNDLEKNNLSLDTKVGSKGTNLSFGQIQMIKVLQSTLVSKDVYIFDEITNGLDRVHKEYVLNFLMSMKGIKIFLTHDKETISKCNKVLNICSGNIEEIK